MNALVRSACVVALGVFAVGCASSHHTAKQGSSVSLDIQSATGTGTAFGWVTLAYVRGCLERNGWPVDRASHDELDAPHGSVVWDIEFNHSRVASVGWAGSTSSGSQPSVLADCLERVAGPKNRLIVPAVSIGVIRLGEPRKAVARALGQGKPVGRYYRAYLYGRLRILYAFHGF